LITRLFWYVIVYCDTFDRMSFDTMIYIIVKIMYWLWLNNLIYYYYFNWILEIIFPYSGEKIFFSLRWEYFTKKKWSCEDDLQSIIIFEIICGFADYLRIICGFADYLRICGLFAIADLRIIILQNPQCSAISQIAINPQLGYCGHIFICNTHSFIFKPL
jgi:hypothetical protein